MPDPEERTLDEALKELEAKGQVFIGLVAYDVVNDQICLRPNAYLDREEINAILEKFDMNCFKVTP